MRLTTALLAGLLIAAPTSLVLAQDATTEDAAAAADEMMVADDEYVPPAYVPTSLATLLVWYEGETEPREYDLSDFSLSLSGVVSEDGTEWDGDSSISASLLSAVDADLLAWAGASGPLADAGRRIEVRLIDAPDGVPEVYEVEVARLSSLSLNPTYEPYVSLWLSISDVSVDGAEIL